jgi:hypothetical protein
VAESCILLDQLQEGLLRHLDGQRRIRPGVVLTSVSAGRLALTLTVDAGSRLGCALRRAGSIDWPQSSQTPYWPSAWRC